MKKYILSSIILLLAAANTAWGQNVARIGTTEYATLADALNAARDAAAGGWNTTSVTVDILTDITFSSTDTWTPIVYNQLNPITINGNNHTITNLPGMLYAKSGSGVSTLTINNLTFESPKAESTEQSSAVIMGYADSVEGLEFNNVHINHATVSGSKWVGAFIGFAAGYSNVNDGPLYQHITFNNCSVTNSTIKNSDNSSGASVGALMGHANGSTDAKIIVNDVTVTGNNISTNETESIKAGALFGTVGALGPVNKSDAGLYVNATVSNNTVKSNGTTIKTIYGRQGSSSGRLTLTEGGSYDSAPIAAADAAWATVAEGNLLKENSHGTYTVAIDGVAKIGDTEYATLEAAITAATDGQTVTLLQNVTASSTITINKSITIDGAGYAVSSSSANPFTLSGFNTSETNSVTFNNVKINATGSSGRGIVVNQFAGTLTLTDCTLTVGQRGVTYGESNKNIDLVISNTTIQNCSVSDPTTQYVNGEHLRGISIWTTNNTPDNTVTLTNTIIKGFAYCINVAGGGTGGTEVTMNGGATYGRAAINNWNKNNTFTLTGVDIHGLNNQTGPTERFACIVDYENADNNVYNITDCTFTATLSDAAITAGGNAAQLMFALRGQNSVANIHGNTTYSSTCPDESRVGLIEKESQLVPVAEGGLNNKFVFDADAQQSLAEEIAKTSITVDSEGNGTTSYVAQVVNGATIKRYTTLPAAFAPTAATNGCTITLLKDITLSDDIFCQLTSGSFYLELDGHSLSRDANAQVPPYIYLNEGVTVYTDVEIDGLLFGLNDCGIAKQDNTDATYKYKYTATDAVAQIGNTIYQTLTDAINAAQGGETILLLSDIGSYDADANPTYTTEAMSTVDNRFNYWINKSITIDGGDNNYSIYVKGRGFGIQGSSANSKIDVTFQNVIVSNVGEANGRCIDTRGNLNSLTLDYVYLTTNESSYTGYLQPLTIGGNQSSPATVTITNSGITTVDEANKGYAITTFNPVNMTITDSEISGWACLNIKGADSSAGSAGSTITVDGGSMTSANGTPGATNAYSLIKIEDDNVNVSVINCSINVNGGDNTQSIVSFQKLDLTSSENSHVSLGSGNEVILEGDYQFESNAGESSGLEVSGGKFNVRVPADVIADGLICPTDANTTSDIDDNVPMWELEQGTYVARIGDYGYVSLAAAVEAANANDIITLIADDHTSFANGAEVEISIPLTITGEVDANGVPKWTLYGTSNNNGYNDLFIISSTGTVTVSNVKFSGFGNAINSKMGHAPVTVSTYNNDVVIDNVYVDNLNCEGIHVNGGTFTIQNCNIDCTRNTTDNYTDYTKGICIVNAATGSITGTTITGVDCNDPDDLSAGIELQGSGDITISGCNIETKTIGISASYVYVDGNPANDQPGTSNVAVSGCTINGEQYALYGNGYGKEGDGALITVTSGTYNGKVEGKIGNSSPGVSISGGTYDAQVPMEYLADTYICPSTTNNDGRYYIEQGEYVAKIADLLNGVNYGYETLAAAVAAAGADDEIILLDDITLDANITCNLEDGEALAITFGTFDITKGNFSVSLPSGVTVVTDKQTDIFSALAATDHIIETYDATIPQYSYTAGVAVASITTGSTTKYYATLADAFEDVATDQTINMLTDVTLTAPMNLELGTKAVSLDLGGNTLTGRTNLKNGNLTIKNGTVAGGEQQALNVYGSADSNAQNYSVLNINSDVNVTADVYGVCLFGPTFNSKPGYGAVINIYGTVTTTGDEKNGAVFVSGNLGNNIEGDMKNVINVYGTITSATDAAIALNGNATVNVKDGATITGNTAIAIKRGTLNVEGGTVHATGLGNIPTAGNNNGTEMTGAAVSMTNTYNQYGAMQVNISGGSFTSDHAMALYKQEGTYQNDATYAVSGGIFNTAVPEEFCADGYVPTSITTQGLTQYTVESGVFVAQIGETKYTTLAAAVAAVPTNGTETTITLLKDITLTNNVVVGGTFDGTNNSNANKVTSVTNQNVILNLDGHTITGTKTLYLAGGSLNITGTGSIISTSQDVAPVGVRYVKTADYPDLDYTSKRTLTIGENVTLTGAQYGLNIFGTNEASTANNIDVTVDGTVNGMLFVLGNLSNANNNIVINVSGTVDASLATGSEKVKTGIALCGNASVHINDNAVVMGESGIEVRAGELIMDGDIGGTITATADYSYEANGSGTTTKGAAIAVAQHGTKIATSATILGGTLTGAKKIAVIDAQNNSLAGVTVIADDGYLDNSDTETVLPEGYYWLSNGDGTSSPAPNSAVAQIGNTLYSTLAAAVAAVPADGTPTTITLLQNINLTERLFVNAGASPAYAGSNNRYATTTENKNITLELDGHNIVSSSNIALAGGSLNITNNGTADATHGVISTTAGGLAPIEVRGTGDLTKKRTLTIGTGVTLSGAEYGLNIFGSNDQQKNIIDVNVNGTVKGMLFVLGNLKNADNEININVNGTVDASGVTGTGEAVHSGIALGGNATVNVNNGATVKGESGIEVRAGQLTVNGGTITGTATAYSYAANGNGTTTKGAAVAVAQHTTVLPVSVTLNGGTLTGAKKIAVTDVNSNDLTDVSVVASNSFLTNAGTDTEIPAGFIWVDNGNNTKKLVLAPVRIGNVGYATLADALNAVLTGQIVKLYADVTLTADLSTNNTSCTFDFNNHNVIQNGYHVMLTEGVTVQTNVQTQLFAAAEGYVVVESNTSSTEYPYEYSVKMSLANAGITITVDPATYNGAAQVPNVTVKKNGETTPLVQGTDYTISYKGGNSNSHLVNADTYVEEIVISGKGNYGGKVYADFIINPRHINDVNYSGNSQLYIPAGYAVDDIKGLIVLTYNSTTLTRTADATNPKDYTVSVAAGPETGGKYITPGIYAGVITLTAEEGEGKNFVGTRTIDFIIGDAINIADCDITATTVYNGAAQDPTTPPGSTNVVVKNGTTVVDPSNYVITYIGEGTPDYTNAGTYSIRVSAVSTSTTYYGSKDVEYVINPKSITSNDIVIVNETTFAGTVIDPVNVVQVKDNGIGDAGTSLVKGTDYSITTAGYTYQDPQTYPNALTITGIGNYTGTVVKDFIITPNNAINLASAAVVISKQTYTGADLKPTAATTTVTVNGTALSSEYYDFSFVPEGDNFYKDAKVYSNAIIITAKTTQTAYYGTAVGNYIIEPRDLSDDGITVTTTDLNYLNREQDVTVVVKYGNNVIPATNYTYTPTKVTEAGHYDITITAVENSNLVGSTTADQWVYKTLNGDYAADFTVEPDPIPTQTYTGSEVRPTIVVKDKDRVMQLVDANGGDYSVEYTNNINEGMATITITGRYAYSGTITKNFYIVNEYFTVGDFTYHHAKEGEEVNLGKKEGANNVPATTATGKVVVPETVEYPENSGHTFTVTGIEKKALGGENITAVVLPQSIAEIEDNAFQGAINTRYVDASAMSGYVPETLTREFDGPFGGLPKQALVYLTGTNITGENYVYKPGNSDDYYCELFKIYDDFSGAQTGFTGNDYQWAFENPHAFTAYTVENTRQLTAGKHYTICLPYSIPVPNNVKAYTLEATSDKLFGFTEVTGTLAAYTPYVLIPSKSGQLLGMTSNTVVPVFQPTTDVDATQQNSTTAGSFTMYGTMRYMEGTDAVDKYIMQYNNGNPTWKQITETTAGFEASNKACILPMRAYIMTNAGPNREFFEVIFTNIDGTTLTFDKLRFDDDAIYDLSGRKVQNVEHGHTYIINGKKIMIK